MLSTSQDTKNKKETEEGKFIMEVSVTDQKATDKLPQNLH